MVDLGLQLGDPLWHMPLWAPYRAGMESPIGDIVNTGRNAMAGAINAALFLEYFVPESQDWLHIDLSAWNDGACAVKRAQRMHCRRRIFQAIDA